MFDESKDRLKKLLAGMKSGSMTKKLDDDETNALYQHTQDTPQPDALPSSVEVDYHAGRPHRDISWFQEIQSHPEQASTVYGKDRWEPYHAIYDEDKDSHMTAMEAMGQSIGWSPKTIYEHSGQTFMVKPYHTVKDKLFDGRQGSGVTPLTGWSTMTAKNLFHSAGLGDMVEDVEVHHLNDKSGEQFPVTVHKFGQGKTMDDIEDERDEDDGYSAAAAENDVYGNADPVHVGGMALLDYLMGNNDRHGGNIIVGENGPLAIDHDFAFNYNEFKNHDPIQGRFAGVPNWAGSFIRNGSMRHPNPLRNKDNRELHAGMAKWWQDNRENIVSEMANNLKSLKNNKLKRSVATNFQSRVDVLTNWADKYLSGEEGSDHPFFDKRTKSDGLVSHHPDEMGTRAGNQSKKVHSTYLKGFSSGNAVNDREIERFVNEALPDDPAHAIDTALGMINDDMQNGVSDSYKDAKLTDDKWSSAIQHIFHNRLDDNQKKAFLTNIDWDSSNLTMPRLKKMFLYELASSDEPADRALAYDVVNDEDFDHGGLSHVWKNYIIKKHKENMEE